jgi:outer membrane scaffolding protein for murein synthesis (MipA/OmpV family)
MIAAQACCTARVADATPGPPPLVAGRRAKSAMICCPFMEATMTLTQKNTALAATALCLLALAPGVRAQAFDSVRLFGAIPGESGGTIGLVLVGSHEYMGSDERRTMVFPALDYQWANGWFAGTTNGVGYNFSQRPDFKYGLRVTADFGRRERRSDALKGMGNIDPSPEIGGFFNYYPTREIFLTSTWRYGAGDDSDGVVIDLGTGYSAEFAPTWRLGIGVTLTLVNDRYMQSFFGVSPEQSVRSGYAPFSPEGGLRDVRASVAITHLFNPRTAITLAIGVSNLQGDAQDSPLTRESTSTNGVLAATYAF